MMRPLILASTSKYRAELLGRLHHPFRTQAPGIDETARPGEAPAELARRLAREKAEAVAQHHHDALVIGSDQVLLGPNGALGKPGDHARAVAQLTELSGQAVTFFTAVCIVDAQHARMAEAVSTVEVRFRPLSADLIERYLRLETPYDCAGSAKSEGLGILLLASVASHDPTSLIGLPLITVIDLLDQLGYALTEQLPGA